MDDEYASGCQNKFGHNCLPTGGFGGYCSALGGCIEYQGEGTPHFHGFVQFVTCYEKMFLQEIAGAIERDNNFVDAIKKYYVHLCREEHFDRKKHQENEQWLEGEWENNYAAQCHDRLCFREKTIFEPAKQSWRPTRSMGNVFFRTTISTRS